jgi:hypothetical protein
VLLSAGYTSLAVKYNNYLSATKGLASLAEFSDSSLANRGPPKGLAAHPDLRHIGNMPKIPHHRRSPDSLLCALVDE